MKTAKAILIVATAILCTGCSSIMMNVLSYRDPELEYQDYVSFSTISWDESEYTGAAEPRVRWGLSHQSGRD